MESLTNIVIAAILIFSTEGLMQTTPFSKVLIDKEKQRKLLFRKCTIVLSLAYVVFGIYLYTTLKDYSPKEQITIILSVKITLAIIPVCFIYILLAALIKDGFSNLKNALELGMLRGIILGLTRGALLGIVLATVFNEVKYIPAILLLGMFLGLIWGWIRESKEQLINP